MDTTAADMQAAGWKERAELWKDCCKKAEARVAELTLDAEKRQSDCLEHTADLGKMAERAMKAEAQAARLREALEAVAPYFEGEHHPDHPTNRIIQAALAEAPADVVAIPKSAIKTGDGVYVNMVRGEIAKPDIQRIIALYGRDKLRAALNGDVE